MRRGYAYKNIDHCQNLNQNLFCENVLEQKKYEMKFTLE